MNILNIIVKFFSITFLTIMIANKAHTYGPCEPDVQGQNGYQCADGQIWSST